MVDLFVLLSWLIPAVIFACLLFVAIIVSRSESKPSIHIFDSEKAFKSTFSDELEPFPSLDDEPCLELSVVIPAYNEEDRLPKMLSECTDFLTENFGDDFEIVIVDDGSKDGTTRVAQEWSQKLGSDRLRALTLAKNLGKGGAVRRGMMVSRGKYLLFADADGATTFSEISKLMGSMKEIEVDGHGLVCGSRAHMEEESIATRSLFRTVLMFGFHMCVKVFGCRSIRDTQCGFKLLARSSARVTFTSLHIERWAFDVELLKIAEMCNIPLAEMAVEWTEIDGSKLNPILDSMKMFKDLFLLWLRYAVGAWKLADKLD